MKFIWFFFKSLKGKIESGNNYSTQTGSQCNFWSRDVTSEFMKSNHYSGAAPASERISSATHVEYVAIVQVTSNQGMCQWGESLPLHNYSYRWNFTRVYLLQLPAEIHLRTPRYFLTYNFYSINFKSIKTIQILKKNIKFKSK